MRKLSTTQAALLTALRKIRAEAEATEAAVNARALGGLTSDEKFQRMGVVFGTTFVGTRTIRGVKYTTYCVLRDAGLLETSNGFAVACK
jgi:hypothetical protein